ncbi:MAG TPA: histidine phosphatase family protein [Patescibacteria group bacterium]|nr:histidine phosphatase family protein [Patescibacteria group bacterium]
MDIGIRSALPEPPAGGEAAPDASRSSTARILLVRHGESVWNAERRIQGQLDPPLSEEGRRQAEMLGRRLAGRKLAGFYTSDLKRAVQTATLIGESIGMDPEPLGPLREIYLGEWEGMRTEELAQRFPEVWARWSHEPDWDLVPGGEGAAAFEARAGEAIDALFQRHPDGEVLVVTHGGVIQVALHRVVGRGSRGLFQFRIQNTSISAIERRNGRTVIGGVNDVSHLESRRPAGTRRG